MKKAVATIVLFILLIFFLLLLYHEQYLLNQQMIQKDIAYGQNLTDLEETIKKLNKQLEALKLAKASEIDQLTKYYEQIIEEINLVPEEETEQPTKIAYLTFDDGPSNNTVKILDILDKYDLKATFFVNGGDAQFFKDIYKRIYESGHTIGNHTYSHNYGTIYHSVEAFMNDFYQLEDLIFELTGVKPTVVRLPGGSNNPIGMKFGGQNIMYDIAEHISNKEYVYFDWNVDSKDASLVTAPKEVIIDAVLESIHNKEVVNILFHDSAVKTTTVEALPIIIENLLEQGFTFLPLSSDSHLIQFSVP